MFCAFSKEIEIGEAGVYPAAPRMAGARLIRKAQEIANNEPALQDRRFEIQIFKEAHLRDARAGIHPEVGRIVTYDGVWSRALRSKFCPLANQLVFAHEVGHHLHWDEAMKHLPSDFTTIVSHLADGNEDWLMELEADAFAGFVLAKLGATPVNSERIMEALDTMSKGKPSSDRHPPTQRRRKALHAGWKRGARTAYSRRANWCPCGCHKANKNQYFEEYETTDDDYNNEAEIYRTREIPKRPTTPEPPRGNKRYRLIQVPCEHRHHLNSSYTRHVFDMVWELEDIEKDVEG